MRQTIAVSIGALAIGATALAATASADPVPHAEVKTLHLATEDAYGGQFSNDGTRAVYWQFDDSEDKNRGDVVLWDSGTTTLLTDDPEIGGVRHATLSRDGSTAAWDQWGGDAVHQTSIMLYEVGADAPTVLNEDGLSNGDTYRYPSLSADGSIVAFQSVVTASLYGDRGDIYVKNASGIQQLTTSGEASAPIISADGTFVVYEESDAIIRQEIASGDTTLVSPLEHEDTQRPHINNDGSVIVYEKVNTRSLAEGQEPGPDVIPAGAAQTSTIVRWTAAGGAIELPTGAGLSNHPRVSDEGTTVIFESTSELIGSHPDIGSDIFRWTSSGVEPVVNAHTGGELHRHEPLINADATVISFRETPDSQPPRHIRYVTTSGYTPPSTTSTTEATTTTTESTTTTNPSTTVPPSITVPPTPGKAQCLISPPAESAGFGLTDNGDDARNRLYRLYCANFQRNPDLEGYNYWLGKQQDGVGFIEIAYLFAHSPEFENQYGRLNDREFVNQMYRNVMGREGETAGVDYWVSQINAGSSRGDVLFYFADSPEFRNLTQTG